jgi:peptidoglycan hydrolase CwlO-like protein
MLPEEINSLVSTLATAAGPLILAVIGIFSGAGFWAYWTKKAELKSHGDEAESKYRGELSEQISSLMHKIEELYETRGELMAELYEVRAKLAEATAEINTLKGIIERLK